MTSTVRGVDGFDSAQYVNLLNTYTGRNKIINGGFDIWQRGTSQTTTSGYGSDDRWPNYHDGSTKTHSRQTFTLGQTDVPGNPRYFSRTVVSSVAGSTNYCQKSQRVEGVQTLAGQTATLSFYAKADSSKNIAIELFQQFGTGGSPSDPVDSIGGQKVALTTSWQRYELQIAIPSIYGKVLGTSNDDYLRITFWFDAGSSYDSRTDSLGQQSGTFDIANVQLEAGTEATPFEQKNIREILADCQRYYEKSFPYGIAPGNGPNATSFLTEAGLFCFCSNNSIGYGGTIQFQQTKRTSPFVTLYGNSNNHYRYQLSASSSTNIWSGAAASLAIVSDRSVAMSQQVVSSDIITIQCHWTAVAEL